MDVIEVAADIAYLSNVVRKMAFMWLYPFQLW